jgi:hypothetical protein
MSHKPTPTHQIAPDVAERSCACVLFAFFASNFKLCGPPDLSTHLEPRLVVWYDMVWYEMEWSGMRWNEMEWYVVSIPWYDGIGMGWYTTLEWGTFKVH